MIYKIGFHHIHTLVLDHLHFHNPVITLITDIAIAREESFTTKHHHVHDTLGFINNEEILDLLIVPPPKTVDTATFLDLTLEEDSE